MMYTIYVCMYMHIYIYVCTWIISLVYRFSFGTNEMYKRASCWQDYSAFFLYEIALLVLSAAIGVHFAMASFVVGMYTYDYHVVDPF